MKGAPLGLAACAALLAACSPSPPPRLVDASPVALYPAPLYATQSARALPVTTACLVTDALPHHQTVDVRGVELILAAGLEPAPPGATCDLTLAFSPSPPALAGSAAAAWDATTSLAGAPERYIVVADARDTPAVASAELYAESEPGALHALTTALALVDGRRRVHGGVIVDAPAIVSRGIVEGYYGKPLSRGQRLCVVEAMERLRQNLYLYGPKNDAYARLRWADPYPANVADDLRAAAAAARARLVDFVWSISPGAAPQASGDDAAIVFSSAADFARLTAKVAAVRALGVDRFALFLDDTDGKLDDARDLAAYASPAAAHADLANRLDDWLTGGDATRPHVIFVGWAYTSSKNGWQDYVTTLGQRLHPGIDVLWTGPATYSATIHAADLTAPDALLGRKVLIWDNRPLSVGPLEGRSADLPDAASGFLGNPVYIESGGSFDGWWRIFGTIADYAWNPAGYDPARSFGVWSAVGNKPDGC